MYHLLVLLLYYYLRVL